MSVGGEQLQPLTGKTPISTREPSSYIQITSVDFKLLISNFFPFFSRILFILLSFPRRTFQHSSRLQNPPSHLLSLLRGGGHCFALTKTLLLSGNYRQRLITTLGSNDAALNEIFIKDPSASN